MFAWSPADGYVGPDASLSDLTIRKFELRQLKSWVDWFKDYYPDLQVRDFRLLGIRHHSGGSGVGADDRVMEWSITISGQGKTKKISHGEEAQLFPGKARNYPHKDADVLDHLELELDGGPGGEMLEQDIVEDFGLDPKSSDPRRE